MTTTTIPKKDIYANVTQSIIEALEQVGRPWLRPWKNAHDLGVIPLPLRHDGTIYRGINVLMLWNAALKKGYLSPHWMTFKQAKALGGSVRKGEKSARVVYANSFEKVEQNQNGDEEKQEIFYMKGYAVFNANQVEGLADDYSIVPEISHNLDERIAKAELFFARLGADIRHGGNRAWYSHEHDYIRVPLFEAFHSGASYAATLAHELIHWTRHPSRLGRSFGQLRKGDKGYAQEELVAEIGAAFFCAHLGIASEIQEDHAPYIASWLQALRQDKRYIFRAASHAQRAVDYLLELGGK